MARGRRAARPAVRVLTSGVDSNPRFNLVDLVARDYEATIEFYRRLGIKINDGPPGEIRHADADFGGTQLHIDNEHLAGLYNAGWRNGDEKRAIIGFGVETRQEVDDLYAEMVAAGYTGAQTPYDAFWGARYAVLVDPDGNHVGLMSPVDNDRKSWPPQPSPG